MRFVIEHTLESHWLHDADRGNHIIERIHTVRLCCILIAAYKRGEVPITIDRSSSEAKMLLFVS